MQRNVPLAVVLAGHVDHGKSSVLGRLLHELGRLPAAKVDELAALSNKRGVPLEWSFVLDAFQAERDQAITLDTTRVRLATARREFVFIDAPGHHELLKNMVGGASMADAALVVVDAQSGAEEQTLRHAYLLKLLGVEELVVAINKMDSVGYDEAVYRMREHEVLVALQRIGLSARAVVPVSARDGANLNERSVLQSWFAGPTLTLALESLHERSAEDARPLRLVVQDVYRFDD